MLYQKLWVWLKDGDECCIELIVNTWRWFIPFGYEGRKHTIMTRPGDYQKRTSVGFLCLMLIYTRFDKLSPYTNSLGG